MKSYRQLASGVSLLICALVLQPAGAAVTNSVPWSDSFESYANGASVVGTNGWSADNPQSGIVTTNTGGLLSYTNTGSRSFPLVSATHTSVLQTTTLVTNDVRSATGAVVAVEIMALPTAQATNPPVSTNLLCAFYINTNAQVVVWHQNRSGTPTNNEWLALTGGPTVDTNVWSRFTVVQDYGHSMFQIRVNEGSPLTNAAGWEWAAGSLVKTGSWFHMVKTNAWLSHVMLGGDTTNLVDDLLLTNRCVTWSTNHFFETLPDNNGAIATAPPFDMAVSYDTFTGTNGQVLDASAVTVTNLPAGLTGVVTRLDPTHLRLTLEGHATVHQAASDTNLIVVLKSGAFTLGNAADVSLITNSTILVSFSNNVGVGLLSCSGTDFVETAANDGAISNTLALTLTGATFPNVPALTENVHYTVSNIPPGLTFSITVSSETNAVMHLADKASAHAAAQSTNLPLAFLDAAFPGTTAANVAGSVTNLHVSFADPPVLTYSGTTFTESGANDGTIGDSNVITLAGAIFTNAAFASITHYTFSNVPGGLTGEVMRLNSTQVVARLTGTAAPHRATNDTTVLMLQFHDAAFDGMLASSIPGSTRSDLAVTFNDTASLAYSTNVFTETTANDGAVGGGTIALTGDTFLGNPGEDMTAANQVTFTNVPAGLTGIMTRSSATLAMIAFTGKAIDHDAGHSLTNLGITFNDTAFAGRHAAGVTDGARTNLAITFASEPVLSAADTNFTEAAANNGSVGNSNTITLADATFSEAPLETNIHYTVANVPDGLSFHLIRDHSTQLTAALSGRAVDHLAGHSRSNLTVTFLNAAFSGGSAISHAMTFAVTFSNQPSLTYSTNTFTELQAGAIDNRMPMTIALSGDTFAGDVAGRVAATQVPHGLSAVFTRDTPTQVSVTLTGAASSHASGNSISNMTFTFQSGAFNVTDADQVDNYSKTALRVTFVDDVGFFNVIPYVEPFEAYTNGFWLVGTNGWTSDGYSDAGIISNGAAVSSNLMNYLGAHAAFPVATNHSQTLLVKDTLRAAIHSEAAALVYVDFMAQPVVMQEAPERNSGVQVAFYVSTNLHLVIWHRNWTDPQTNEWLTLQNGPLIDTSRWTRFTIAQDYTRNMFQLRVNEGVPLADPAGWTAAGAPTGSWFHMVQTNGTLSHFILSGTGQAFLDDLTVRTALPATFGLGVGSLYKFR